jgi:RNA polymerase sigma-70 factor, ECF subfamily
MVATCVNGQPAAAAYRRGADGVHDAYGVVVLDVDGVAITSITVFADPGPLVRFGLLAVFSETVASSSGG